MVKVIMVKAGKVIIDKDLISVCVKSKRQLEMKYRLTPLNIASILLLGLSIFCLLKLEGLGIGLFISFLLLGIISFVTDFFFQKYLSKYLWTFLLEILILGLIYFYYLFS